MKYNVTELLNTYGQDVKVFVEKKDGKWVLTCDGEEIAKMPEEQEENADDAAYEFEQMGFFAEIEEWCEKECEREIQEWRDYEEEVIETYWQNAI